MLFGFVCIKSFGQEKIFKKDSFWLVFFLDYLFLTTNCINFFLLPLLLELIILLPSSIYGKSECWLRCAMILSSINVWKYVYLFVWNQTAHFDFLISLYLCYEYMNMINSLYLVQFYLCTSMNKRHCLWVPLLQNGKCYKHDVFGIKWIEFCKYVLMFIRPFKTF